MIYGFILGKNPELSLAEINHYLKNREIKFKILDFDKEIAIIEMPKVDENKVISDLGGTIKISENFASDNLKNFLDFRKSKIRIGLSVYPKNRKIYEDISEKLKNQLREYDVKYIFISPKFYGHTDLKHFEVLNKILKKNGVEIIYFSKRHNFFKTIAVHDPSEFKIRDVGRPRQRTIYSIPPRLAKILINLSAKPEGNLLDPFCGIGTILQEAVLMNLTAIGIDNNPKCIKDAKENLDWIKEKYGVSTKYELIQGDAKELSKYFDEGSIDAIATEPYLGPPLKSKPNKKHAKKILNYLEAIYLDFLVESRKILKNKGRISVVLPNFLTKDNEEIKMDIDVLSKSSKLRPLDLIQDRKTIIDADEKQMTRREITIFEK